MSGILVDTHIALWALGDPARLTAAERELMLDPVIERVLSAASIWEAAIKREAGRLRAPANLATLLGAEFTVTPLDAALLERAAELPQHHRDPFDRVLIAQALRDELPVLTRDAAFAAYRVRIAAPS